MVVGVGGVGSGDSVGGGGCGGRAGTTRVAVTIAVAVAVAIVDAVVVALAVPNTAIALAVVAVALAAVLVVAAAGVFVGGDSRRCGWVTSCCVVVRLLAAREWVGWCAGCGFVVGYSCWELLPLEECLGAKASALLVKRNSESESFCVCMGQRAAGIFAIFLLILQIVVNNLMKKFRTKFLYLFQFYFPRV